MCEASSLHIHYMYHGKNNSFFLSRVSLSLPLFLMLSFSLSHFKSTLGEAAWSSISWLCSRGLCWSPHLCKLNNSIWLNKIFPISPSPQSFFNISHHISVSLSLSLSFSFSLCLSYVTSHLSLSPFITNTNTHAHTQHTHTRNTDTYSHTHTWTHARRLTCFLFFSP